MFVGLYQPAIVNGTAVTGASDPVRTCDDAATKVRATARYCSLISTERSCASPAALSFATSRRTRKRKGSPAARLPVPVAPAVHVTLVVVTLPDAAFTVAAVMICSV